ncbi:MAG: hypothetical protein K2X55_27890 [Burkholderiaceae bacterium]|nr:hypothetical protein [Burkholderiaceae bacterium]
MSALGSLVVKLALEYAEYTRGLERSDQAALSFAQRVQQHFDTASNSSREFLAGMARNAIGAVAALATVSSVVDKINRSIDSLAALDDLAQKTGAAVENLSRLQQTATAFGVEFSSVDGALTKLAKGMAAADEEGGKVHKALAALGLKAKDANGNLRDASDVFIDAAKALQKYEDGAAKAALINDLLGKSGTDMLPFLNDVAESVDKFTGVTQKATEEAARYQDQLGMLRAQHDRFTTTIVADALPAVNDLLGAFTDMYKADGDLNADAGAWADDLALGIARVVDVAKILPGIFSAIAGSFKAVYADIELVATISHNLSPAVVALKLARGENPIDDMRKALAERNKVLDDANRRYDELWNKPANQMEQAMLKRMAERKAAASSPESDDPPKDKLGYTSGKAPEEKQKSDYDQLNKALQEKIALSERELELSRPLTEAERMLASMQRGRTEGTVKLSDGEMKMLETAMLTLSLNQQLLASHKEVEQQQKQAREASEKLIASSFDAARAAEDEVANFGKLPAELTRAKIAKLELHKAALEANEGSAQEIATTEGLILANERLATAQERLAALSGGTDVARANELLQVMEAVDDAAQRAAAGMEASFGRVGAAIGKLTTSLTGYSRTQASIAAQLAAATKAAGGDQGKIQKATAAASLESAQAQMKHYGDLAGAAKGFFKENSAGYRAMEGAEKAYRAFEMAMAVKNMLEKSGLLTAFTGLFVASKQTETAATVASVGPDVEASMVKGQAAAAAGVAAQAIGDPYSAWARMAAMAAVMAALGFAVSGGGGKGDTTAKDRQAAAGTGSVLGDDDAKSDSIKRSIDILADNSSIELAHTAGMLSALRKIENSIGGLGNLLVRESGLTGKIAPADAGSAARFGNSTLGVAIMGGPIGLVLDKLPNGLIGKLTGKIFGAVFGGKVTTQDTGLTASRDTLGGVLDHGVTASQYTDTKKSGGWFHSDKYNTSLAALGDEADHQFTQVIKDLALGVTEAGKLLGLGGDEFSRNLAGFVVDLGKISLKDLKGEEIQKQLEAVFSKLGDDMARHAVDGLANFQRAGEGYFETLSRIAANYANLDAILASMGTAFGATGIESIAARERFIDLAGGIDELAEKASTFAESFMSEAERLAPVQKYLEEQLQALGYAGLKTRDDFKAAILDLANSGALATKAGAETYTGLLSLAEVFDKVHPATERQSSALELARSKRELEIQIMMLQGDKIGALAAKRELELAEVDKTQRGLAGMAAALQDLQDAQQAYDSAVSNANSAVQTAASQYQAFVDNVETAQKAFNEAGKAIRDQYAKTLDADKTARNAIKSEQDKITAGYVAASDKVAAAQQKVIDSFSKLRTTLTDFLTSLDTSDLAGASLADRQAALQAQFATKAAQARAGDVGAAEKLPEIAKELLTVGKETSASAVEFERLVAYVRTTIADVVELAAKKVGNGKASDETSELDKALAEQKRWAEAVSASGASLTQASGSLLAGYNEAVTAQKQTGAELAYWVQVAQATNVSLDANKFATAELGAGLIKGFFEAQHGLVKAQAELEAANRIKADLELRQTSALENFVTAIKDVNTAAKDVMAAGAVLFAAAGNKLLEGSAAALAAQQAAREGMNYWGSVVTSTAAGIAASVSAMADAAAKIAASQAASQAAAAAAIGAANGGSNDAMVRGWYANNAHYKSGGKPVEQFEVDYWLARLRTEDPAYIKERFAEAAARDHGFSTPLPVSAFALGGDHAGGVRLVGEEGPELEVTGPSRIVSARQTRDILRGAADSPDLAKALQELSKTVARQQQLLEDIERSTRKTAGNLQSATRDGQGFVALKEEA